MKSIEVVAAILTDEDKILATRRGYGEFINKWEFPGGKMEPDETKEDALHREIKEELAVDIIINEYLTTVNYDYPNFHLTMHCYLCSIADGQVPTFHDHNAAAWVTMNELDKFDWLPADIDVINKFKER